MKRDRQENTLPRAGGDHDTRPQGGEELFRSCFRQAGIGLAILAPDGRILEANAALCDFLGYSPAMLLTLKLTELIHPDDVALERTEREQLVSGKAKVWRGEQRYRHKDGYDVWALVTRSVVENEQDGSVRVLHTVQDTSDRKRFEVALAQEREFLQGMLENSADAVALFSASGTILYGSPGSTTRLLGYTPAELVGRNALEIIHPDYHPFVIERVQHALAHPGKAVDVHAYVQHKNGSWRFMEAVFTNLLDDPSVGGIVNNYRDATERHAAEEQLYYHANLLTSVSDAVISTDLALNIKSWNKAAERMYGWQEQEVLGKPLASIIPVTSEGTTLEDVMTSLATTGAWRGEVKKAHRDGRILYILSSVTFVKDKQDNPIGAVAVNRDITDLKRSEQHLSALSQRLMQLQEDERRALARELHDEIGQALTALKLNLQGIKHGGEGPQTARKVDDTLQLTSALLKQVRELSLGLHPSVLEDLGLVAALRWYADHISHRAGFTVHVDADPAELRLPAALEATCYRITQEALANVVRHARASHVGISLKRHERTVVLSIRDDGTGFDTAKFSNRDPEKLSLGLVGMRERASLLQGNLKITSVPGVGTTVTVEFPLSISENHASSRY